MTLWWTSIAQVLGTFAREMVVGLRSASPEPAGLLRGALAPVRPPRRLWRWRLPLLGRVRRTEAVVRPRAQRPRAA